MPDKFNLPVLKLREDLKRSKFGKVFHSSVIVRWMRDQNITMIVGGNLEVRWRCNLKSSKPSFGFVKDYYGSAIVSVC